MSWLAARTYGIWRNKNWHGSYASHVSVRSHTSYYTIAQNNHHTTLNHLTSLYVTSHHVITPHHITSHLSHNITSHITSPHHLTSHLSHYVTSHITSPHHITSHRSTSVTWFRPHYSSSHITDEGSDTKAEWFQNPPTVQFFASNCL